MGKGSAGPRVRKGGIALERAHHHLRLAENLVVLERGDDEMLLVDAMTVRPLYIPRGREYVRRYLDAVRDSGSAEGMEIRFPLDGELLAMLTDHGIVRDDDPPAPCHDGCSATCCHQDSVPRNEMSLYLLLSQSCNLGCIYCLNGTETYHKDGGLKMTDPVAFRSVERCLGDLAPHGRLEIVFFGGEPLLNWPLARRVIVHCEEVLKPQYPDKAIRYHVTSNLTVLPDDLIDWARKHEITFLCDVDGPAPVHDACRPYKGGAPSHARTVAHIRRLTEAGLRVALRATITSRNQDCLPEIARHHRDIGGTGTAFVPVNPVNSDEAILPADLLPSPQRVLEGLAQVFEDRTWDTKDLFPFNLYASHLRCGARNARGCGAPYGNTPVVDVNGDVYPCIYLVGIQRYYLGNLMDGTYPDRRVLDAMMEGLHVDHMAECRSCAWRYICGGGCPVGKLTVFDNPLATPATLEYCRGIRCDYARKIIELLLWREATEAATSVREDPAHPILC